MTRLSMSYRLGLLSDGLLRVQRAKLEALGLEELFEVVVFSDELGRDAWKPSTRPFERMLELLQVPAPEAVYVGENSLKRPGARLPRVPAQLIGEDDDSKSSSSPSASSLAPLHP